MARLVWQRNGDTSMEAWAKRRPKEAVVFRRALLVAAGQSRRRQGYYQKPPYSLAALADDRCAAASVAALVRDFDKTRVCCHRVGLAQHLKEARVDLSTEAGRAWAWPFALTCTLSLSDDERQHAGD